MNKVIRITSHKKRRSGCYGVAYYVEQRVGRGIKVAFSFLNSLDGTNYLATNW